MARLHTTGHSIHQIAATLDRAPSTVARELTRNASTTQAMPTNKTGRAAGRAPSSTATARYAPRSWRGFNTAGRPNRWPAASPSNTTGQSSPTRRSTASSTPRSPARKSTLGATICPGPKQHAAVAERSEGEDGPGLRFCPGLWTSQLFCCFLRHPGLFSFLVAAHLRLAWRFLVATQMGRI